MHEPPLTTIFNSKKREVVGPVLLNVRDNAITQPFKERLRAMGNAILTGY